MTDDYLNRPGMSLAQRPMRAWSRHFPEFGVTLIYFGGALTPDGMMRFIDSLQRLTWNRRIIYLDPALDLSGLDIAYYPVLRRALAAKLRELYGQGRVPSALVSDAPVNEFFLRFWPSYVGLDVEYPTEPASFSTFEEACKLLGVPEGAAKALAEAVQT